MYYCIQTKEGMKKKSFIFSALILFCLISSAQILSPVKWSYSAKKIEKKSYELHITAFIDDNWHLYSQDAGEHMLSTSFNIMMNPLVKLDGKVLELGNLKKVYDPNLRLTLKYYYGQVDFIQKIKMKSAASTIVKGSVKYIVCSDKDRKCLPAKEIPFSIKIDGI